MGVTLKPARTGSTSRPRPEAPSAPVRPRGRYTRSEARIELVLRDGRYHLKVSAIESAIWRQIHESFKGAFPRHGDAVYNPTGKYWSLPLHVRQRLAQWAYAVVEPAAIHGDEWL